MRIPWILEQEAISTMRARGVSLGEISDYLFEKYGVRASPQGISYHLNKENPRPPKPVSPEMGLDKAFEKFQRPFSITEYQHFRSKQKERYPAAQTLIRRHGSWSAACQHYKIPSIPTSRDYHSLTRIDVTLHIADFLRSGEGSTLAEYSSWRAKENKANRGRPSVDYIRVYGGWKGLSTEAMSVIDRPDLRPRMLEK